MSWASKANCRPCPDDQSIVEVFGMAAEESQKPRICNPTFSFGSARQGENNPGLAASYKSLPCRERPGVNSSKSLATSSSCLR